VSDQLYYQYAFAQPDCSVREIGPGVDPRFPVELLCDGPVAAVVSQVGWDQSDLRKLQAETAEDIGWLKRVALRHHEIICQAASSSPVLPLRLGTLFRSRASLLAAVLHCQATVADFLRTLADRQEWAVRLYLEKHYLEATAGHPAPPPPHHAPTAGVGTDYLKRKRAQLQCRRKLQAALPEEIRAVENLLKARAERCCRVRAWPAGLTSRREKMVFNAAFLLPSSETKTWLATVGQTREAVRRKGLLLEVTGPWPPYHFCPTPEL